MPCGVVVGAGALAYGGYQLYQDYQNDFAGIRGFGNSLGSVASFNATFDQAFTVGAVRGSLAGGVVGARTAGSLLAARSVGARPDFFAGTRYSSKVLRQMEQRDFHGFPRSVEAFQSSGRVTKVVGGDGVPRLQLDIPGGYLGREGTFRFLSDPDGVINHRMFHPGP